MNECDISLLLIRYYDLEKKDKNINLYTTICF